MPTIVMPQPDWGWGPGAQSTYPPPAGSGGRRAAPAGHGSDLDDDREDHRPALRLLVQEARDAVLDLGLQEGDLADVVARVLDRGDDPLDGGLDHAVVLRPVDEAAGDDLGPPDDVAGLLVDGDDDHEHAVVGEGPAVAEDDVPDLADRQAVDEDVAGRDRGGPPGGAVGQELDRLAGLDDEHVLRRDAGLDRQAPMLDLHPELAVDRDEVLRLREAEHELQLFLAGVARDMGPLDRVVEDVRAGLEEVVDRPAHVLLVAGDRAGADDDRVALADLDEAMVAVGHPGEARHRLALGARRAGDEAGVGHGGEAVLGHD